jgi:multicomponent Na+:H+ antiporter subunit G
MTPVLPWLADLLVIAGLTVVTLSVWGVVCRRRLGVRIHAAGKALFLGLMPLLLAAVLVGDGALRGRAVLVAAFLILTTPVAAHAIARAVWRGERPAGGAALR